MLTTDECKRLLQIPSLNDEDINKIRDYLYNLVREIIKAELEDEKTNNTKTN